MSRAPSAAFRDARVIARLVAAATSSFPGQSSAAAVATLHAAQLGPGPHVQHVHGSPPCAWALAAHAGFTSSASQHAAESTGSASPSPGDSTRSVLYNHSGEALAQLTPMKLVERLDRFIIGQEEAKKAVAVAFRNRWRRKLVDESIRDDIVPKNILMIGPTGCGKTEIARRLAKLADAPFVKVEATKFTEVGYHGRDVETIIKDLVEASITLVRSKLKQQAAVAIAAAVDEKLVRLLAAGRGSAAVPSATGGASVVDDVRERLRKGELESAVVDVEVAAKGVGIDMSNLSSQAPVMINLDRLLSGGGKREKRRMPVSEARGVLEEAEAEKMFPAEVVAKEAIKLAEQDGIVFIDEIDKIAHGKNSGWRGGSSGDPSSEGVQRDLLPIIEGSTVNTKHGNVNTDHMLFVCSGAFHSCKPSDLMAELQGRLPIRVELKALTRHDFYRILTEPQFNLIKQQQMLLSTEGVDLQFTDAAVQEIARVAEEVNRTVENIGARRLHTVLERIMEEISFAAPDLAAQAKQEGKERFTCIIDKDNVESRVTVLLTKQDLTRYII